MSNLISKYLSFSMIVDYYPWIALFLGLGYWASTPPIQSPDEQNHFYKAWHVSDGHWFAQRTIDNRLGGMLPISLKQFTDPYLTYIHCDTCKIAAEEWNQSIHISVQEKNKDFIDFANTGFYFPINYTFPVVAIWVAKIIGSSVATAFYIGRLLNLLVWIGLTLWALKLLPWGKLFFVILWLLPSSLAFHMSLNQDVLIHGVGFVAIAWMLKQINKDQNLTKGDYITFSILTALLTLMKPTLIPLGLIPVLWIIRQGVFPTLKFGLAYLLPLLCFYLIVSQSGGQFIPYDQYHPNFRDTQTLNPGVDPAAQLEYILLHPLQTIWTFIFSFAKGAPSILAHYTAKFGWLHNYPPVIITIGLILLIGYIQQKDLPAITSSLRIGLIMTIVSCFLGFSITMYMLWVPVGHPDLWNLQARYFFLFAPLILILVPKIPIITKIIIKDSLWITFLFAAHIVTVMCIIGRYWA